MRPPILHLRLRLAKQLYEGAIGLHRLYRHRWCGIGQKVALLVAQLHIDSEGLAALHGRLERHDGHHHRLRLLLLFRILVRDRPGVGHHKIVLGLEGDCLRECGRLEPVRDCGHGERVAPVICHVLEACHAVHSGGLERASQIALASGELQHDDWFGVRHEVALVINNLDLKYDRLPHLLISSERSPDMQRRGNKLHGAEIHGISTGQGNAWRRSQPRGRGGKQQPLRRLHDSHPIKLCHTRGCRDLAIAREVDGGAVLLEALKCHGRLGILHDVAIGAADLHLDNEGLRDLHGLLKRHHPHTRRGRRQDVHATLVLHGVVHVELVGVGHGPFTLQSAATGQAAVGAAGPDGPARCSGSEPFGDHTDGEGTVAIVLDIIEESHPILGLHLDSPKKLSKTGCQLQRHQRIASGDEVVLIVQHSDLEHKGRPDWHTPTGRNRDCKLRGLHLQRALIQGRPARGWDAGRWCKTGGGGCQQHVLGIDVLRDGDVLELHNAVERPDGGRAG
mmetsp:Transcript_69655/g.116055  ORF Transcript_69655/g.116055 Transcript_69655/m.116055 type:complete len:506 (+) Transcript_69655:2990-4507(+)